MRPHVYCLPILKREEHREAVLNAAVGPKSERFFLGTDSAPHPKGAKESACGCAGVFSAHAALSFYAMAFGFGREVGQVGSVRESQRRGFLSNAEEFWDNHVKTRRVGGTRNVRVWWRRGGAVFCRRENSVVHALSERASAFSS